MRVKSSNMIGVIGINHSSATLEIRENVGQALLKILEVTPCLSSMPHIVISTCNRTEWYFSSSNPLEVFNEVVALLRRKIEDPKLHTLYSYFGVNCFIHLYRVVCGFDSAFIGETEIQGQVKIAYQKALEVNTLTSDLHYLFQKALHSGKVIRKLFTSKMQTRANLEVKILERMRQIEKHLPLSSELLLIGASMINQRICHALKHEGRYKRIFITSRTANHAEAFASKFSISCVPFEVALVSWKKYPCIISAVKSQTYIIPFENTLIEPLNNKHTIPALVIDLGVPRNIDPKISCLVGILENIETLGSNQICHNEQDYRTAIMTARNLAISHYKKMLLRSTSGKSDVIIEKILTPA